jgi:cysteine synthase
VPISNGTFFYNKVVKNQNEWGEIIMEGIGIKAPFIVGFDYKECIDVKGEDAYATGREIARTDGVFLGQSAAAAIYAATTVAKRPENAGKNIVVILADNGMKYLSTNMYPLDHKVQ